MHMITFEGIRRVYEEEKRKQGELSKVPDNFFSEIKQYIVNRQDEMAKGESPDELETAKRRLESVFEMRERKIINSALDFVRTEARPENMLEEEDVLFKKIVSDIEKFREEMSNLVKFGTKEEKSAITEEKSEDEKVEVKSQKTIKEENNASEEPNDKKEVLDTEKIVMVDFIDDVHEFVGIDLKIYGPFTKGDIATIPEENALVIKRTGKGEIIDRRT